MNTIKKHKSKWIEFQIWNNIKNKYSPEKIIDYVEYKKETSEQANKIRR